MNFTKTTALGTLNVMALSANVLPMATDPGATEAVISLAPNPVDSRFTVQHPATAGGTIRLQDLTGRELLMTPASASGATSLDIATLPAGIYLLRYADVRQSRTIRVVKQ